MSKRVKGRGKSQAAAASVIQQELADTKPEQVPSLVPGQPPPAAGPPAEAPRTEKRVSIQSQSFFERHQQQSATPEQVPLQRAAAGATLAAAPEQNNGPQAVWQHVKQQLARVAPQLSQAEAVWKAAAAAAAGVLILVLLSISCLTSGQRRHASIQAQIQQALQNSTINLDALQDGLRELASQADVLSGRCSSLEAQLAHADVQHSRLHSTIRAMEQVLTRVQAAEPAEGRSQSRPPAPSSHSAGTRESSEGCQENGSAVLPPGYAAVVHQGQLLGQQHKVLGWMPWLKWPQRAILQASTRMLLHARTAVPGMCVKFAGASAQIDIRLRAATTIRAMSFSYPWDLVHGYAAAPKRVDVFHAESYPNGAAGGWVPAGVFVFQIPGPVTQRFSMQPTVQAGYVRLRVSENYGHNGMTCMYPVGLIADCMPAAAE